jgi:hypothetical protein
MARNRRLRDLAAFIEKVKAVPRSPVLKPQPSGVLNSVLDSEKGMKEINGKQGRREESPKGGDKKDPRAGLLTVSQGAITAAKLKEKEREKNIERFYTKMGDLRDRITEEKELRDQNGKKGRREESSVGDGDKREQRAGLLTVAPGVLTAAKQKEKDRERNVERASKIRGERRPGGRLVDTRTSGGRVTAREKERERNKERERERETRFSNKSQSDVQAMKGTEEDSSTPTRRQQARRSNGEKEDFPPLPGAREPHSHSATLNYAASALFNPAAPADMDPFDNDSTSEDEYDEDAFTEDGDLTDEDEAGLDAFYVGDAEEVEVGEPYEGTTSWAMDTGHMGSGLGHSCAIPSPVAMQPSGVTASGVFGGLFSTLGSGSSESLFAGYGGTMEGSMADLMPAIGNTQSVPYEDDDAADDVVVFRPAFSRINAGPSSNQPPPLSYIGDSPTPALQPYLTNTRAATSGPSDMGLSSNSHRRSDPFGLSGPSNTYDDRFESTVPGIRGPESTWHPWDRSSTPTLSCAPDEGGYGPIPMGSMVFGEYAGMTDPVQVNHSPRNLGATDAWWAKQSSSDVVNSMPNLFNAQNKGSSEPEYVSTRGSRGPPALQLVPPGWTKPNPFPPAHPPGLVPPPPGFSNVSNNQANSYQQQGQGPGQRNGTGDPWTANPFYRSSG